MDSLLIESSTWSSCVWKLQDMFETFKGMGLVNICIYAALFHFYSTMMVSSKTIDSFTVTSTEFTGPLTIGAGCISCNDDTWCNSKLHTWNSTSPSKFRVVRQYYNFLTRPSWKTFCTENIVDCCMPLTIFITQELGWPSPLWYSFGFFYNF